MGLLSILFGLFEARVGDLSERRSQRVLRATFASTLATGAGLGRDAQGRPAPIGRGTAVAFLDIPRAGVRKIVVEGGDAESLKKGPGVVLSSVLPGQPGQTIIVGRRTTFGSPFRHLEVLAAGDGITAITPFGRFEFKVRDTHTVRVGEATSFPPANGSLLTLVTSDPPYVGGRALVVDATLQGHPSGFGDPPRVAGGRPGDVALSGNAPGVFGVIVSGFLLLAALIATDRLYRTWRRWPTYLLTTPVILALLFAWMENLTSLFPSAL